MRHKKKKSICCWLVQYKQDSSNETQNKVKLKRPVCTCVGRVRRSGREIGSSIFIDIEKDCLAGCYWRNRVDRWDVRYNSYTGKAKRPVHNLQKKSSRSNYLGGKR